MSRNRLLRMEPIKVFISYTHDSSAHSKQVLDLSNRLRSAGFDCDIDQYHANQDWPAWMERSIAAADFVLMVCSPTYLRRWNNQELPGVGLGAQWESLLTRQHLYLSPGLNNKFVPVGFTPAYVECIPTPLTNVTRVLIDGDEGFDRLVRRLLNIAPAEKPPIRTSLAPIALASGFFTDGAAKLPTRPIRREGAPLEQRLFGLIDAPEDLFSNLFPVVYPRKMQAAKLTLKRRVRFDKRLAAMWKQLGHSGNPPVDYLIEEGVLYRFAPMTEGIWTAMANQRLLRPLPEKPCDEWAQSRVLAKKNLFIKLLNRSLDQLCASPGMAHEVAWSKPMKCHLFVAKPNTRVGKIRVMAIKHEASREVYKAIPDKLSDTPGKIQHWQHQAFRHYFVRFGQDWYLNLIPFWAFTSDGQGSPSRWQKSSSANMRRPEKNRAVLGHVMFWASILCREPDLFRPREAFALLRPHQAHASRSIDDSAWIRIAKEGEKQDLKADLDILL